MLPPVANMIASAEQQAPLGAVVRPRAGGDLLSVVYWYGDDFEGSPLTVCAQVPPGGPEDQRAFARVRWGNKAAQIEVEFDVDGRGQRFSTGGSAVDVRIGADAFGAPGEHPVAATLSWVESKSTPLCRTSYVDQLGPDLARVTKIPAFAERVYPCGEQPFHFYMLGANKKRIVEAIHDPTHFMGAPHRYYCPIPSDAAYIEVRNNEPTPLDAKLIFDLAL